MKLEVVVIEHGGYVPYMVLPNETVVTHTKAKDDLPIFVYFEKPDEEFFFKFLEINLGTLEIINKEGFTPEEIDYLIQFAVRNRELMFEYAETGGIMSA